jgi:hypothetical protein
MATYGQALRSRRNEMKIFSRFRNFTLAEVCDAMIVLTKSDGVLIGQPHDKVSRLVFDAYHIPGGFDAGEILAQGTVTPSGITIIEGNDPGEEELERIFTAIQRCPLAFRLCSEEMDK